MDRDSSDDSRLRAAELQMRRALGLDGGRPPAPATQPDVASHQTRPHRRFVRDGEVPVTVLHNRDEGCGVNKLAATQAALREQTAAREQAEHDLREAQDTIKDLRTKLAHEQLARGEDRQRADAARADLDQQLAALHAALSAEHVRREQAEAARDKAVDMTPKPTILPPRSVEDAAPAAKKPTVARRRKSTGGAAAEPSDAESEIVEWWVPGWQDRYRRGR